MQAEKQRTQQNTNTAAAKPGAAIKLTQAGKQHRPSPKVKEDFCRCGAGDISACGHHRGGVLVYLNVGGLRQKLVTFAGRPAVEGETEAITAAELEQKQKELDDRAEAGCTGGQAEENQELSDKEKELKDWDAELKDREERWQCGNSVQQRRRRNDEATAKIFAAMDSRLRRRRYPA